MSDAFWIALFAAVPSLASLVGVIYSIRVSQGNRRAIDTVKKQTDGLVEASKATSRAEGVTQGHAEAAANDAANKV